MRTARRIFIASAIPFSVLSLLILIFGRAEPSILWCSIYIFGSISVLRGHLPLSYLVLSGLVLNLVGAVVWVPALFSRDGGIVSVPGMVLSLTWLFAIVAEFREERR
jgi:hypothetical protein